MTFIVEVSNPYSAEELVEKFECETLDDAATRFESEAEAPDWRTADIRFVLAYSGRAVHVDSETGLTVTAWRVEGALV